MTKDDLRDAIIKKQDEIIDFLNDFATFHVSGMRQRDKLQSELTSLKDQLKAELEKEETIDNTNLTDSGFNDIEKLYIDETD